jgi:hypothetical protein
MLAFLRSVFQPFNVPREASPLTLAEDPIWTALRDKYRKDQASHAQSLPSWKALSERTHALLRGGL